MLRDRDILRLSTATTPCSRIYLAIQLMYVEPEQRTRQRETYETLIHDVLTAAPSTRELVDRIETEVAAGRYYQALKVARELLTYEQSLLAHAHERA